MPLYYLWYGHTRTSFNWPKMVRPDHFIPKFGSAKLFSPGLFVVTEYYSIMNLILTHSEKILLATVYTVHLHGVLENLASITKLKVRQHYLESCVL